MRAMVELPNGRSAPPPSPCNLTCIVDRERSWCMGCLRTLEEIAMWEQMSVEEQWAVIDRIAERRATRDHHGS